MTIETVKQPDLAQIISRREADLDWASAKTHLTVRLTNISNPKTVTVIYHQLLKSAGFQ